MNTNFEETESFFNITQKLILGHSEEILNVKPLESSSRSWTRSVLSHDQAIKWAKAKVRVYSDPVLCVGQTSESKEARARWEGQVEELKMYPSYKELAGIDGEAIEFEWIFPQYFRHCRSFKRSTKIWKERTLNLKSSRTGSSSCQCSTTLIGQKEGMRRFASRMQKNQGLREEILARTLDDVEGLSGAFGKLNRHLLCGVLQKALAGLFSGSSAVRAMSLPGGGIARQRVLLADEPSHATDTMGSDCRLCFPVHP